MCVHVPEMHTCTSKILGLDSQFVIVVFDTVLDCLPCALCKLRRDGVPLSRRPQVW